jgi:hypothetical protein
VSFDAIRQALAANLSTLEVQGVQVSPYMLSSPTPPTVQLLPGPINYQLAMGHGLSEVTILIQAFDSYADPESAQRTLDKLMTTTGNMSIVAAAESDKQLGGAADDLEVTACSGVSLAQVGGVDVLLAEWTCLIYPSNL